MTGLLRMRIFVVFLISCFCVLCGLCRGDLTGRRRPRAIWQFSAMIECATSRRAWDFNNYGCWCGLGGGGASLDDTDECCRIHDECYDALVASEQCTSMSLYFSSYLYQRRHCQEQEAPNITCDEIEVSTCSLGVCDCDREAALCLARARYNDHHSNYDTELCLP